VTDGTDLQMSPQQKRRKPSRKRPLWVRASDHDVGFWRAVISLAASATLDVLHGRSRRYGGRWSSPIAESVTRFDGNATAMGTDLQRSPRNGWKDCVRGGHQMGTDLQMSPQQKRRKPSRQRPLRVRASDHDVGFWRAVISLAASATLDVLHGRSRRYGGRWNSPIAESVTRLDDNAVQ
jgi:hypothetical protein